MAAAEPAWFARSLVGLEVGPTGAQFGGGRHAPDYARHFDGREIVRRSVQANAEYLVLWMRDGEYTFHDSQWVPKPAGLGDRGDAGAGPRLRSSVRVVRSAPEPFHPGPADWPFLVRGPATVYEPTTAAGLGDLPDSHRASLVNPESCSPVKREPSSKPGGSASGVHRSLAIPAAKGNIRGQNKDTKPVR